MWLKDVYQKGLLEEERKSLQFQSESKVREKVAGDLYRGILVILTGVAFITNIDIFIFCHA